MIDDIILKSREKWNKRLKKQMEEKNYTQTSFVNELNEKFRKNANEKEFTQATAHGWLNVGTMRGTGKTKIGFPKFENMLLIAELLEVDLGYLIGETDAETFTLENASDFLHLEPEALKRLKRIIEKESIQYVQQEYSTVLNKLLCSEYFERFVESLKELEDIYMRYKDIIPNLSKLNESELNKAYSDHLWQKISDKYGEAILNQAWKHHDSACVDEATFDLTNDENRCADEIGNMPCLDILIKSQRDWQPLKEKSLTLLNEMDNLTNKYGERFLKKFWSSSTENLTLTEEQKKATHRFYNVRSQFNLFLKNPFLFNIESLALLLKEIQRISDKYSNDVLERAWEHHRVREANKDIEKIFSKNECFISEFKKEMSYHRFLVQESLVLLLNDIYPISVDLRNIF